MRVPWRLDVVAHPPPQFTVASMAQASEYLVLRVITPLDYLDGHSITVRQLGVVQRIWMWSRGPAS